MALVASDRISLGFELKENEKEREDRWMRITTAHAKERLEHNRFYRFQGYESVSPSSAISTSTSQCH